jgi:hypothetical protein
MSPTRCVGRAAHLYWLVFACRLGVLRRQVFTCTAGFQVMTARPRLFHPAALVSPLTSHISRLTCHVSRLTCHVPPPPATMPLAAYGPRVQLSEGGACAAPGNGHEVDLFTGPAPRRQPPHCWLPRPARRVVRHGAGHQALQDAEVPHEGRAARCVLQRSASMRVPSVSRFCVSWVSFRRCHSHQRRSSHSRRA